MLALLLSFLTPPADALDRASRRRTHVGSAPPPLAACPRTHPNTHTHTQRERERQRETPATRRGALCQAGVCAGHGQCRERRSRCSMPFAATLVSARGMGNAVSAVPGAACHLRQLWYLRLRMVWRLRCCSPRSQSHTRCAASRRATKRPLLCVSRLLPHPVTSLTQGDMMLLLMTPLTRQFQSRADASPLKLDTVDAFDQMPWHI